MSLISIIQAATLRCNVNQPTSAIGSSDPGVLQFIAYAQDSGDDAFERWTWLSLKQPVTTFTGDGTTTLFALPANFGVLSPSTVFTSSIYPTLTLSGPVNEDTLLVLKQLPVTLLPSCWRRIGNYVEFFPAPAAGEVISYVYGSKTWITDLNGVPRTSTATDTYPQWQADTDLSLINERLIMLGTVWRWKRSKGLDYSEEFRAYEMVLDRKSGQENTERTIAMSRRPVLGGSVWPGMFPLDTTTGGDFSDDFSADFAI